MKQWFVYLIGLLIMAFGVVLVIRADLGSAPWDVLHIGLNKQFGLTIGSWSIIIGIIVLGTSTIIEKELPKLGAFLNMILVGIFMDIYLILPWLKTPTTFIGQLLMLVAGIIIMAYGMAIYVSANRGTGPRDSLMLALMKKTKIKVQWIRLFMEIAVLAIGWLLGGMIGIGTIIYCLTIGHVTGIALPQCQKIVNSWVENKRVEVKETSSSI